MRLLYFVYFQKVAITMLKHAVHNCFDNGIYYIYTYGIMYIRVIMNKCSVNSQQVSRYLTILKKIKVSHEEKRIWWNMMYETNCFSSNFQMRRNFQPFFTQIERHSYFSYSCVVDSKLRIVLFILLVYYFDFLKERISSNYRTDSV